MTVIQTMNEYLTNLPKKRMGSGALVFNKKGEVLLVKPNYKAHWSIPGGTVDANESPRQACIREVKEEVGITLSSLTFLCVEYTPAIGDKNEALQFVFNGGVLTEDQVESIKIQETELDDYRFVNVEKAPEMLGGHMRNLAKRFPKCLEAIKTGTAIYLEDGKF